MAPAVASAHFMTQGWYPCDIVAVEANELNALSDLNRNRAQRITNQEDINEHPNPEYQKSLDIARRAEQDALARFRDAYRQMQEVIRGLTNGNRREPCCAGVTG
jgi:DNA topoisomerase VI subunit A